MPRQMKLAEIAKDQDTFKKLIERGCTRKQLCEKQDVFMGTVNAYLRGYASQEVLDQLASNEKVA